MTATTTCHLSNTSWIVKEGGGSVRLRNKDPNQMQAKSWVKSSSMCHHYLFGWWYEPNHAPRSILEGLQNKTIWILNWLYIKSLLKRCVNNDWSEKGGNNGKVKLCQTDPYTKAYKIVLGQLLEWVKNVIHLIGYRLILCSFIWLICIDVIIIFPPFWNIIEGYPQKTC